MIPLAFFRGHRTARYLLFAGGIFFLLQQTACSRTPAFSPQPDTNILLVVIDVLRADHVGSYGYERDTTPRIDSLARSGVRFETAISSSGWTRPSISSLFTSLDPIQHGVLKGFNEEGGDYYLDVLEDSYTTISEILRFNGYESVAVAPNAYTRPEFGFGQGFSTYYSEAENGQVLVDHFLSWLEEKPRGKFFGYLHFMDVHWPYDPPEPFDKMFGQFATSIDFDKVDWNDLRQWIRAYRAQLTREDLQELIARYDGGTRYVDEQLSRLFDRLADQNLMDGTLIVITADHGEEFMEHGRLGHGRNLYDCLLKVPLIMKFPGNWGSGTVIENQVRLVDIMPTILETVGIEIPGTISGHSLIKLISTGGNDSEMPEYAYSEHLRGDNLYRQSIRKNGFKFIRSFHPSPSHSSRNDGKGIGEDGWSQEDFLLNLINPESGSRGNVIREFFDLNNDPGEKQNIFRQRMTIVRELEKELDRWMRVREPWISGRSGKKSKIDPETVKELRNLGYIQ